MRKYVAALAAVLPCVAAGAVHAAPAAEDRWSVSNHHLYGEIGYTRTELDSSVKAGFNTVNLRFGGQVNRYWGAEMDAGTGLGDASVTYAGYPVKVRMNYQVGVYAVGFLPVAKNFDLFARAGAVGAQFGESVMGVNTSNHENGWAAGVGVRYFPNGGPNGIRVEYTRYGMQDDANNFGISYVRKF